jgi:hypothetical protein
VTDFIGKYPPVIVLAVAVSAISSGFCIILRELREYKLGLGFLFQSGKNVHHRAKALFAEVV